MSKKSNPKPKTNTDQDQPIIDQQPYQEPEEQPKEQPTQPQPKDLLQQLKQKEEEIKELKNQYARAYADYQNLEKRMEKEKEDWIKFGNVNLLTRIISILDNLDRAAHFIKDPGLDMVRNDFVQIFKEFQVEEIQTDDKEFDPNQMEAIDKQPGPANKVLKTQQKGYSLNGRVLRPAQVTVGTGEQ